MSDRLEEVVAKLREFVAERDWEQFHDPKNLAMAVASEAGELLAEYRWLTNAEATEKVNDAEFRTTVGSEVADVAIALILFCESVGLDLYAEVDRKIEINRANYPVEQSKGIATRERGDGFT